MNKRTAMDVHKPIISLYFVFIMYEDKFSILKF